MAIKTRLRALYTGDSQIARRYRYGLLIFDVAVILYMIVTSFFESSVLLETLDVLIGLIVAAEFGARLMISRDVWRDLLMPAGIADVVVILSLLVPVAGEGFAFVRVLRTLRLMRSYHLLKGLRADFLYFRRNEATIFALINLALFVFVTTALVFELEHKVNPGIQNYADALYFTVATLTTTGFGDVTLSGPQGRLISVAIMIFGVSLFVRLIQILFRPAKATYECTGCGLTRHDPDAVHCKHCGKLIHIKTEGAT
ncbi:MAG: potassium channel family protein [Alphaproteobacteria bacterium]|nr:potassium channel family protein [Alphaproteobacteria bacterium]